MRSIEILRHKSRLDSLFERIGAFSNQVDPEIMSHWSKYLCVLVSGFLESSTRTILREYAKTKAAPNVVRFVDTKLKGFQNPKMNRVLELTRLFSAQWENNLRVATEGEIKDAVDSIVENKNKIAHGEDVGITYGRIFRYYKAAIKLIELIDEQCC